jgi:hypothetical protein
MPNIQRLTWNGIALHGGPLPGYAASHGCVRMPYDFAENLFDKTWIGMRVIISPNDAAPVEFYPPGAIRAERSSGRGCSWTLDEAPITRLPAMQRGFGLIDLYFSSRESRGEAQRVENCRPPLRTDHRSPPSANCVLRSASSKMMSSPSSLRT